MKTSKLIEQLASYMSLWGDAEIEVRVRSSEAPNGYADDNVDFATVVAVTQGYPEKIKILCEKID